jgi:hypothetical protein
MQIWWALLGALFVFLVAIQGRSLVFQKHYFEIKLSRNESILSGIIGSETPYWAEVALDDASMDVYTISEDFELLSSGPALLPIFPFRAEEKNGHAYIPFSSGLVIAIEFDAARQSKARIELDFREARLEVGGHWTTPDLATYRYPIAYTFEDSIARNERGILALEVHEFDLGEKGYAIDLRYPASLDDLKEGVTFDIRGLLINEAPVELPLFHFTAKEEKRTIWAISKDNAAYMTARMDNVHGLERPY